MSEVTPTTSPYVLGIDLGTSNSSVSVYFRGQFETLPINGNSLSLPSVVRFADKRLNEIIVGENAKNYIIIKPNEVFSSIKSFMRNDDWKQDPTLVKKHTIEGELITPTQIAAEILKAIRFAADQNEKFKEYGSFNKACISVPANSSPVYKKNVMLAAEIAGLGERDDNGNIIKDKNGFIEGVFLIDEPIAASFAYGLSNGFFTEEDCKTQNILVYDFGGGTFDVSILNIVSKKGRKLPQFTVKETKGIPHLGGDTIDWEIVKHFASQIQEETGYDILDLARDQNATSPRELRNAQNKIKNEAERVKINFAGGVNITQVNIPELFTDGNGKTHSFEATIEKKDFLSLIDPLLKQTIDCVKEVLHEANMSTDDINRIVLVGGSCKGPWVKERILNKLGKEPYIAENVDTIVSQGNAYYGVQLLNSVECPECNAEIGYKPTPEKPCSSCGHIGNPPITIVTHHYGFEVQGGYFAPMIEKGLVFEDGVEEFTYSRKFSNAANSASVIVTGFITQESLEIIEENGVKKTAVPIIVHEKKGDNQIFEYIGEFELRGIPKALAGAIPIDLTLTIRKDNTISVTAKAENGEEKIVHWNI